MKPESLKILKYVAKHGEVTVGDVTNLSRKKPKHHREQYPFAVLISEEFIGISVNTEFEGAENMPELTAAQLLHISRLEPDENNQTKYETITTTGNNLKNEKVFIRAKGALYLDELKQKRNDRIISFLVGFCAALIPVLLSQYIFKP